VELRKREYERREIKDFPGDRRGANRAKRERQQHRRQRKKVNEQRIRPGERVLRKIPPKAGLINW